MRDIFELLLAALLVFLIYAFICVLGYVFFCVFCMILAILA